MRRLIISILSALLFFNAAISVGAEPIIEIPNDDEIIEEYQYTSQITVSESYLFHYYSSLPSQYNSTTKSWTRTITKTTQTVDVTAFSKPNNSSPYLRYTNSMGSQTDIYNVQTVNCYVPYNALGTTATISVTLMGHTAKPGTYGSEGTVTG